MKASLLTVDNSYHFFLQLVPALKERGIEVEVNSISPDTDVLIGAILPITPHWTDKISTSKKPAVAWHWDYFSFVDHRQPRYRKALELLPHLRQIWSCSHETARQLKEHFGLDSEMVPAWIDPDELLPGQSRPYVMFAASSAGFGKRVDWAVMACEHLGLELHLHTHQELSRKEYLKELRNCRVYVMPAFEESNGTIPAMEAMCCGKPVVVADIPSNREVFGRFAHYFNVWDLRHFKEVLRDAWETAPIHNPDLPMIRMINCFSIKTVADRIARLLRRAIDEA